MQWKQTFEIYYKNEPNNASPYHNENSSAIILLQSLQI